MWKFDRFARSVSHLLGALDTFRALGLEFLSFSEALDTATPSGRMTFTVLGAVAELERSLIAERVKAGIRNARSRGIRFGRPKVVADVPTIRRLRAQDRSWRSIGRELGNSQRKRQKNRSNPRNKSSIGVDLGAARGAWEWLKRIQNSPNSLKSATLVRTFRRLLITGLPA
jgi:DNA invertase Pin-like site-specific DNA recombinase